MLSASALGVATTLLSTFASPRRALATYPDIMGCESVCSVVATGWPLRFIRDYPGMSVVNRADFGEALFAADTFDWLPFVINAGVWTGSWLLLLVWRSGRPRAVSR